MPGRHTAAVLWTGGKDSCLALHEACALGYSIGSLVTFGPPAAAFRAHPIPFLQKQAEAMGLAHRMIELMPPLEQGYQRAFRFIRDELGVSQLITGDIDEIGTHPNWVKTIAGSLGLNVVMPLWKRERTIVMDSLIANNYRVLFSYVRHPWLGPEWVGRELTETSLGELKRVSMETGMDLCGEQGEYHTLVLDGPMFINSLHLDRTTVRTEAGSSFLDIQAMSIRKKDPDGVPVNSYPLQPTL